MKNLTMAIALLLVGIGITPTYAQVADIVPVDNNKQELTEEQVESVMSQVVDQLPVEKKQKLINLTTESQRDDFGRSVSTVGAEKAVSLTPQNSRPTNNVEPINNEAPPRPLSSMERLQANMMKKYKGVQRYKVNAGDNITLPAAKYILNRIKVNFSEIAVRSSDPNVVLKVEGSHVYFSTESDAPFGLIMFEKGVPDTQINVSIVPLNVMPAMVDIKVRFNSTMKSQIAKVKRERQHDIQEQEERIRDMESELLLQSDPDFQSNDYETSIDLLVAQVAGNGRPNGFDLSDNIPDSARYPCRFDAYAVTKQRLISSRRIVDVVLVENKNRYNVVLEESQCWIDDDVISTGILNRTTLAPGEKTEVYVVRDRLHETRMKSRRLRPSLLD
ncbi:hypothetical protein [Vibrio chaetopteri]|uniref:Periplasmic protein n=1 Tax=Vibrio chaetopteri TaxID=3016528 RepID=A0AAU8BSE9_9VIBR